MSNNNGEVIKDFGDIIYKMLALLASLVTLKFTPIGETLFAKHYMSLVLAAVMVYFLLWIFYTLVLLHHTTITITTLFPISLLYAILCAVSFAAFRMISPNTNFAIFNLALWLLVFLLMIAFIYYFQNQTIDHVAAELPLVQLTVNGDGNISVPEQLESVAGDKCVQVPPPCMTGFDRDCEGMVDLEENRVAVMTMMETDAR